MSASYWSQNMMEPLRSALAKRPDPAYSIEDQHKEQYTTKLDLHEARREHAAFTAFLLAERVEVTHRYEL